jgi:hypothetical protein
MGELFRFTKPVIARGFGRQRLFSMNADAPWLIDGFRVTCETLPKWFSA